MNLIVPPLPRELIDHIISYIGLPPNPDLAAAGLVCRAWVEPVRRVRFHTVRLRLFRLSACATLLGLLDRTPAVTKYIREFRWDLRAYDNLNDPVVRSLLDRIAEATVEHSISHRIHIVLKRNGGKTFAAILDRAPAIAPFVCDIDWFFDDREPAQWTDSNVGALDLARRLRHVSKLALFQIGRYPFKATAPFGTLSETLASTSVTQLHLRSVVFSTTAEYASLVSSFPSLRDLCLSQVEIEDKGHLDNTGFDVPPSLRSFVLGSTQSKVALISYLLRAPVVWPLALQSLSASVRPGTLGAMFDRLLPACGATLKTLSLDGLSGVTIDLSPCHELVNLRLKGRSLHRITTMLGTIRSEHLRSLKIQVNTGKDEDWQRLRVTLAGVHFALLDVLHICYWSKDRHTPLPQSIVQPLQRKALIWEEHPRSSEDTSAQPSGET